MADRLVSVVIPVRDDGRYLAESLDSVLNQTHPEVEAIVVDDGSADDSAAIARSYGKDVTLISQRAAGPGAARNRGIKAMRGSYIAFQDADDISEPRKLEVQLDALAGANPPDLVFGHLRQFISPDVAPEEAARLPCPDREQPARLSGLLLAPINVFERVGLFARGARVADFFDWLVRAGELGMRELVLPDLLLWRRVRPDSLTASDPDGLREYARVIKASLDRRRDAG